MNKVKRWEPRNTPFGYDMQPLKDGSFVLFEDFERLLVECKEYSDALTEVTMWPDGGNTYGQGNIKIFATRILSGSNKTRKTND